MPKPIIRITRLTKQQPSALRLWWTGIIYSLNGASKLVCLEAATGKEIWETERVTREKNGTSACMYLTVNGNSVFIFNELGELILAYLSPKGYEEICRTTLLEPTCPFGGRKLTWAPPSFANAMFMRVTKRKSSPLR